MPQETNQLIIAYLIQSTAPISTKKLALLCDISVNTLRKQISNLNTQLKRHGLSIVGKQALGCYLHIEDPLSANLFINRFRYNLRRSQFNDSQQDYRAHYIVRRLLSADRYISVQQLSQELFYSASSISRELTTVKNYLNSFQLNLKIKRNQGLYLEGDEFQKRLCILFQHKRFIRLTSEQKKHESAFAEMLISDGVQHFAIRHQLIELLKDTPAFQYSYLNIPKVSNYLILCKTRHHLTAKIRINSQLAASLGNSEAYPLAGEILASFENFLGFDAEANDQLTLTMILSAYRSLTDPQTLPIEQYHELSLIVKDSFQQLQARYSFVSPISAEQTAFLICQLYLMCCQQTFGLPYDGEAFHPIQDLYTVSADLSLYYARQLASRIRRPLLDSHHVMMTIWLTEELISRIKCTPLKLRILLISMYGIEYASYLARQLQQLYPEAIKQLDVSEELDLNTLDMTAYELFITDINPRQMTVRAPVVTIGIDMIPAYFQSYRFPDYPLSAIRQVFNTWLNDSCYRTNIHQPEQVFRLIAEKLSADQKIIQDYIHDFQNREQLLSSARTNKMAFITTDQMVYPHASLMLFINQQPLLWNHIKVQLIVFYSYDPADSQQIKLMDIILKKLLSNSLDKLRSFFADPLPADQLIG